MIKNRIAGGGGNSRGESVEGPEGDVFAGLHFGNAVALAKALTAYAKANPSFTFRAAVVQGRVVDVSGIANWRLFRRRKKFTQSFWVDQRSRHSAW